MLTHDPFTPMNSTVNVSPDCFVEIDNIAIYEVSMDGEVEGKGREEVIEFEEIRRKENGVVKKSKIRKEKRKEKGNEDKDEGQEDAQHQEDSNQGGRGGGLRGKVCSPDRRRRRLGRVWRRGRRGPRAEAKEDTREGWWEGRGRGAGPGECLGGRRWERRLGY